MAQIKVNNEVEFANAVSKYLNECSAGVRVALEETVKEVAKESVKKVKANAPKRTGAYKKSWASKVENTRLKAGAVVYAKAPHYRLTHLLENGHAKRGGGRVAPRVHIAPVNDWAHTEVVNRFTRKVESEL